MGWVALKQKASGKRSAPPEWSYSLLIRAVVHFYAKSREMMVRLVRKECDKHKYQIQETIDLWNRKTFMQNYWELREEGQHAKRRYSRADKSSAEEGSLGHTKRRRLYTPDLTKHVRDMSIDVDLDVASGPSDKGKQKTGDSDMLYDAEDEGVLLEPGNDPQPSSGYSR
ncbi:hypothetical protein F5X96DRAFT_666418 [Biscogniauxia mediterranea]|nr:hypothetical protein F5X96DRAFT_666418 [Biscogniauxia mediterranea]